MRKAIAILTILILLFLYGTADAFLIGFIKKSLDGVTVNGTAIVKGDGIRIGTKALYFGVWYKATSVAGMPKLKLEAEVSWDDTDANYVEPEGAVDISSSLTDENPHAKNLPLPPMMWLRFKVTGIATNPTDTKVWIYLFYQKDTKTPYTEIVD